MTDSNIQTDKRVSKPKKPATQPQDKIFPRKSVQVLRGKDDSEEECSRKMTAVMTTPEMAALRVIKGAEQNQVIGKVLTYPHCWINSITRQRQLIAAIYRKPRPCS